MAYTRGRCTNFDYCSLAAARRDIEVLVGHDFVCPECGKGLKAPPVQAGGGSNFLLPALIGGGVLVLVGGAVFLGMRMGSTAVAPPPATVAQIAPKPAAAVAAQQAPAAVTPAATAAETVLIRLAGSDLIGATLARSLAASFLAQIGDTDLTTEVGSSPAEIRVVGLRGDQREAIVVNNADTASGFRQLAAGTTDVVMASRRISPAETTALSALGDLTAPAAEHLLALGGLAVVVNAANPVTTLKKDDLRRVFTGAVKDWKELGGTPGPIAIYARDPQSEAGASFATLALESAALAPTARKMANAKQVSEAVSADPHAIGVVDLPNILQTHALAIADTGAAPSSPTNRQAIASEYYPLAYRLYLYNAPKLAAGNAQRFITYATGPGGQAVLEQVGLVAQPAKAGAAAAPVPAVAAAPAPESPLDRLKAIVTGTKKLPVVFRFNPNSSDLDQPGTRDIDRVTNYLMSNHYTGAQLILVGFADNQGEPAANIAVSKRRADALAAMFTARGLPPAKVVGFGAELPLADNATEEGRQKNRRVEIYIVQ